MAKKVDMLLVYPRPTDDSPVQLTPLSILFPGAMFEAEGKTVAYFDQRFDPPEMLDQLTQDSNEIGVSAFTGFQCGRAARILLRAKRLNPEIVTHVGGHHARLLADQVLAEPFVDNVWPERSYGEDLFPFNERTRIHFQRTDMQYFTSRGCPFPCTFCALTSPWQPKPIEDIDRELKTIHDAIGFTEISFSDPNISFGAWKEVGDDRTQRMDRVQRIRDIGKVMRDLNVRWDGNIRSPHLTPDMIEALVESNCYSIEIGCESGNDHFLRKVIHKGHGVETIKNAALNVRGSGISIMYSFIAYMPRETPEMRRDTFDLIDWIVDTDPDARVSLYHYAPYPGSPMYEDAGAGVDGYPPFHPPTTMEGWGNLRLMLSPIYWIVGLNFRMDNTRRNFPGADWKLIEPYVDLARQKWDQREMEEFPCQEVEQLIAAQIDKNTIRSSQFLAETGV